MTSFQGTKTPPPQPASAGLIAFAMLFSRIAVICFADSCQHQMSAWPSFLHSKLHIIDSSKVNVELGIADVDDHGYRVTQGHARAWDLLSEPDVNSVLIFEDDYTTNEAVVENFEHNDTLLPFKAFVDSNHWKILRVGYHPLWPWSQATCPGQCSCKPPPQTNLACAVTLGRLPEPHCDVRCHVPTV